MHVIRFDVFLEMLFYYFKEFKYSAWHFKFICNIKWKGLLINNFNTPKLQELLEIWLNFNFSQLKKHMFYVSYVIFCQARQ
jgi:hypothetical protein